MIKIDSGLTSRIGEITNAADLRDHVQAVIELEHSTIPPYLTALYSIKPGRNKEAYEIINSVVKEEMLHMVIAANLLNALGGRPKINSKAFVPDYPCPLPLGINDELIVGLEPLSIDVVKNTFMEIEEPEPSVLKIDNLGHHHATIGQYYAAIKNKIVELGESCIIGESGRQVASDSWFPANELFAIESVGDAVGAIEIIIEQGEGSTQSVFDPDGEFAHYYRFGEIAYGRKLVRDDLAEGNYSYTGEVVPLDEDGVWPLVVNSKSDMYEPGSKARRLVDQFNYSYTNLLNVLHQTFDGKPDLLVASFGLMYELKLQAQLMVEIYDPRLGGNVAPSFEYATLN